MKKRPLAKTKCKNCGNFVYSRKRPIDEAKVLLTKEDAEIVELQWKAVREPLVITISLE